MDRLDRISVRSQRQRLEEEARKRAVIPAPGSPVEPGVAQRSAATPAHAPTRGTAQDARARARNDPLTRLRRQHAERALAREPKPNPRDPFVKYKSDIRAQLGRLGVNTKSDDRVHIDDVFKPHGEAVTRTAAGRTSLVTGGDVRLNTEGLPRGFKSQHLTAEQQRRFDSFDQRADRVMRGNPGIDQMAKLGTEMLERALVEKQQRLENIRNNTPNDGKKTFVNMSWGQSPHEAADHVMKDLVRAPRGSKAHREVTKFLGHEPRSPQDGERVMRGLVYPAIDRAMKSPAHQARMRDARAGLEAELTRGRDKGILAFQAAGNFHEDGTHYGRPDFSKSSTDGVRGLLSVGAVDLRGPGPADDRVAPFSSDGRIDLSAPGVNVPTGPVRRGRPTMEEGTSFAAPNAVDVARAMSAANPRLSANDIARLIVDPRAVNDIKGTTRDGAGHIDPFAAVMLARDSTVTRAQIEELRRRSRP